MEKDEEKVTDRIKRGLSWAELKKSLEIEGCPVCNTVLRSVEKYFEFMLYEYALDVSVHKKMLASMGMCNTHYSLLQEAEIKLKSDGLNIAVLQETILQKEIKLLSKIEKKKIVVKKKKFINFSKTEDFNGYKKEVISDLETKGICQGCLHQKGSESFYIHEIIRLFKDEEFQKKYEDEKILLCRNHFLFLLNEADNAEIFDYFINLQLQKITILQIKLAGFVAKHDYRLRKEMTDIEEKSWAKVLEYFGSKKYITSIK